VAIETIRPATGIVNPRDVIAARLSPPRPPLRAGTGRHDPVATPGGSAAIRPTVAVPADV